MSELMYDDIDKRPIACEEGCTQVIQVFADRT
jgi:hypothetical protein